MYRSLLAKRMVAGMSPAMTVVAIAGERGQGLDGVGYCSMYDIKNSFAGRDTERRHAYMRKQHLFRYSRVGRPADIHVIALADAMICSLPESSKIVIMN